MISSEAVEAAVRAMPEYTPEDEADSFDLKANEVLRGKVEMILEAAAPNLMAGRDAAAKRAALKAAWDEGWHSGWEDRLEVNPYRDSSLDANPYKKDEAPK